MGGLDISFFGLINVDARSLLLRLSKELLSELQLQKNKKKP
jgi:hypothetical protein